MLSLLLRVSHYFSTFDGPATAPEIDLARRGLGGIPSIWHSPTTRQPGGSPRRNRRMRHLALLPGWRVVALQEIDGMPHPTHLTQVAAALWPAILEICPPGEGTFWLRADPIRSSTATQRCGP